ncbi:MAG: pitrilysin family protein [Anaerolineae bacterium]
MLTDNVIKRRLDNGLTVLIKPIAGVPVASLFVWYRVGSRNEVTGRTGISHWVEHMLFKGTEAFPGMEADRLVARDGGYRNAMTYMDWTTYFETLPVDRFDLALRIEADRMVNAAFRPEEVESERTVIISERQGMENFPDFLLAEELHSVALLVHPYRHETIGWLCDLQAITRDELYEHYRTYYTPSNAVLVAVGGFDADALMRRIEELFGPIPDRGAVPPVRAVEPAQHGERRLILKGPGQTSYLAMGFHVPQVTHDDFFPLVVMDTVLSGARALGVFRSSPPSQSSRLYQALVEADLALDVSTGLVPTIDPYLFTISATIRDGRTPAEVEEALIRELDRLMSEPVQADELTKAIKQTRAEFAYGSESVTDQAYWLGFAETVASLEWLESYLDRVAAVSAEDIQRVAQTYLQPENRTTGWYVPVPATEDSGDQDGA